MASGKGGHCVLVDITEFLEFFFAFAPVWVHFYEHFEEYFLFKEFLHVAAGLGAYAFQRKAFWSYDDSFLGLPDYVDDGADVVDLLVLLKCVNYNLGAVRDLLVVVQKDLLADDL